MVPNFYIMRPNIESYRGLFEMISYINRTSQTSDMTMIEIGSYVGESTKVFADYFKRVISVDPFVNDYDTNDLACKHADFSAVYKKFIDNMSNYKNVTNIRKPSDEAVNDFDKESIDFVYIDGCHTYKQVARDILNYMPLIKPGGFIGGHDYTPNWPDVIKAITDIFGGVDKSFEDGSWIKLKI